MSLQPLMIVLGAFGGLIAGSFIGALVLRWPRGESMVRGRSHCDSCGHRLGPLELVPVIGYLTGGGRCRWCDAAIPPVHLAAEIAAAMVGASAFAAAPPLHALGGVLFGWSLVALALLDIEHLWLPDRLTLPLILCGLGAAAAGVGVPLADSVIGATAGYAALTLIALVYRSLRGRTGLGGGDPKLLAAIGAWAGWRALPEIVLLAGLVGLTSVALAWVQGKPVKASDRVPLGALLALAAWPLWLLGQAGMLR